MGLLVMEIVLYKRKYEPNNKPEYVDTDVVYFSFGEQAHYRELLHVLVGNGLMDYVFIKSGELRIVYL